MRYEALKSLIFKAAVGGPEDMVRMPLDLSDRGGGGMMYSMAYDRRNPSMRDFCGPDWTFVHWPDGGISSFESVRDEIVERGRRPPRTMKAAWFGNIHSPSVDVPEHHTRPLLLRIGSENPEIMDFRHVRSPNDHGYMSMPDMVSEYAALVDIGGNGYSGRLKWLLFSRRPVLIVERDFVEYFHEDLEPWVHYVPVKHDLEHLVDLVRWVLGSPGDSSRIAEAAFRFATENFSEEMLFARIRTVYENIKASTGRVRFP